MAMAERSTTTVWEGDLPHGNGTINGGSGALEEMDVTWASRTQRGTGKTSPEELVAAAHSSCFSMALANELSSSGHDPERLEVTANVTLDEREGAPTVTTSELTVKGKVPGIDPSAFEQAARSAGQNCPISRALAGVEITVNATLEQ